MKILSEYSLSPLFSQCIIFLSTPKSDLAVVSKQALFFFYVFKNLMSGKGVARYDLSFVAHELKGFIITISLGVKISCHENSKMCQIGWKMPAVFWQK